MKHAWPGMHMLEIHSCGYTAWPTVPGRQPTAAVMHRCSRCGDEVQRAGVKIVQGLCPLDPRLRT
eukprot:10847630-Alexandrium_andersonii.AAC.1